MLTHVKQFFAAMIFLTGLAACSDAPSAPELAPARTPTTQREGRAPQMIPDRYVVVFERSVQDAPGLARRMVAQHGGTMHYIYQHALKGFAATLPATAVEALKRNPNVAYLEQDQRVSVAQVGSWGLDRVDQRDLPLNGGYTYANTGAGVTVYIFDTGIQTSHWDFGGRASVGYDAFGGNGQDCHGHGTHVAGTVGGATYGVAKAVSLVAVRVQDCNGEGYFSGVIAGIDWVRFNHATPAVANLSLIGGAMQSADDAIQFLEWSGVTTVVAAGNWMDDACNYSPARAPAALTVGASDSYDQQAAFSNYGSCVDLYAPGVGIISAGLNGGIVDLSGTSMASPHVAGAAALYLQVNPSAHPVTAGYAILKNATTNRLSGLGSSSPNRLVYAPFGSTTPTPGLSVTINGPTSVPWGATASWTAHPSGGSGTYSYRWDILHEFNTEWSIGAGDSYTYYRTSLTNFSLRVTVTSGGVSVTSPVHHVVQVF